MMSLFSPFVRFFRSLTSGFENPEQWFIDYMAGGKYGKIAVNEKTALAFSAVYKCINCISQSIAMLPVHLFKRTEKGKEKAVNHPLFQLIHLRPNFLMPSYNFFQLALIHLLLWGNFYAQITINNAGHISGLFPLDPSRITPHRIKGGMEYQYITDKGKLIKYPGYLILHIKGFSLDGLVGLSQISLHRESIGFGMSVNESGKKFFENGLNAGHVLESPRVFKTNEGIRNLQDTFIKQYAGLENAHRPIVLEEGVKLSKLGVTLEDAQYIAAREFSEEDIAGIFRVPPHKIGLLKNATYSNIEMQSIEFVQDTLQPWITLLEQTLNWELFTKSERAEYFIKFNINGMLRGTFKERMQGYQIARMNGFLNGDEIRELEDLNITHDGSGLPYWRPKNMEDAGQPDKIKEGDK